MLTISVPRNRLRPTLRFGFLISPAMKVTPFHASLEKREPTIAAEIPVINNAGRLKQFFSFVALIACYAFVAAQLVAVDAADLAAKVEKAKVQTEAFVDNNIVRTT